MKSEVDEFHPVLMFGFVAVDGKEILHQMWVNPLGHSEYRPVPLVKLDPQTRTPCVVGFLPDDVPGAVNWTEE